VTRVKGSEFVAWVHKRAPISVDQASGMIDATLPKHSGDMTSIEQSNYLPELPSAFVSVMNA
jgi:hypothetical protein